LWVLREDLGILGPKFGCGLAQCGACTVHVDGVPMRSCILPISSLGTKKVVTVESLANDPVGRRVQAAWTELDVAQCGYCQAGQIMTAAALLKDNPKPSDDDIDGVMAGNLCRCATYMRIRAGIKRAAELAAGAKEATQ
jgi:isoquinoline 1-oxidoreductase alpha subunit